MAADGGGVWLLIAVLIVGDSHSRVVIATPGRNSPPDQVDHILDCTPHQVDDLIVNERPNALYVKRDVDLSAQMIDSYKVLKSGGSTKPDGVDNEHWQFSMAVKAHCEKNTVEGKHYRIIESAGKKRVIQLDEQGNVPKVSLTSPWLIYLNYALCDIEPFSETRHACVCTPYVFNKYEGTSDVL